MFNFYYQLENDEILFLHDFGDVSGTLDCKGATLLLTNKNLIVEYATGFLKKKKIVEKFPLNELQQYDGDPKISIKQEDEDTKVLAIAFSNTQLNFLFDNYDYTDECCEVWKNNIIRCCQDISSRFEGVDDKMEKRCPSCGQKVFDGAEFCTNCGAKLLQNDFIDKPKKSDMPLDQQIELLQKMKSLVDAGVISQEEFEKKKKEIL